MLWTLTKKQFDECFRTYFINRKTGKTRSKGSVAGLFVLFGAIMLFLCAMFFFLGSMLGKPLLGSDMQWLYFTIMGTISLMLGVFGSVFNSYASLYLAKDNDLLLSMPIKPGTILLSRVVMVFLLSLLYSGVVWIPGLVYACIHGVSGAAIVSSVILSLMIPLLVTVITCALGWVIALIATRIRSKSILTVIISVCFFVLYEFVCMNMGSLVQALVEHAGDIGEGVRKWAGFLYMLGMAGSGSMSDLLIICAVTTAAAVICYLILSRSFMHVVTHTPHTARRGAKASKSVRHSLRGALLLRELKRFTSSATYMMNCGFAILMVPVLLVLAVIYRAQVQSYLVMVQSLVPQLTQLMPLALPGMLCLLMSMNCISLPSVSLEGKNLWILASLPVTGRQVLESKRDLHILLNLVPSLISCAVLGPLLKLSVPAILGSALFVSVFMWFTANLGLVFGVKHPNLKWTSEQVVIKQNLFVLIQWVINLLVLAATGAAAWFLRDLLDPVLLTVLAAAVLAIVCLMMEKWLHTRGAQLFDALS